LSDARTHLGNFHGPFTPYIVGMNTVIRIIKHAESYEVRTSRFFYFR